jgi:uncharacterized protein YlxW (UPF0749 family)
VSGLPAGNDLATLHRDLGEVKVGIGRLTERLDRLLADREDERRSRERLQADIDALALRVSEIERQQAEERGARGMLWRIAGAAGVGGSGVGAGASYLLAKYWPGAGG